MWLRFCLFRRVQLFGLRKILVLFGLVICMVSVESDPRFEGRFERRCIKCDWLKRFNFGEFYLCRRFGKIVDNPFLFVSCEVEQK